MNFLKNFTGYARKTYGDIENKIALERERTRIEKICIKYNLLLQIDMRTLIIHLDGVDYDGIVRLSSTLMHQGIPFKFRNVGSFDCSGLCLTDLKNAPDSVEYDFDCSHNNLTSLKGVKHVGGVLRIQNNQIRFLDNDFVSIGNNGSEMRRGLRVIEGILNRDPIDYCTMDLKNPISDFFRIINNLYPSHRLITDNSSQVFMSHGICRSNWFERLFTEYDDWRFISPDGMNVYKDRFYEFLMGLRDDSKFELKQSHFNHYKLI